MITRKKFSYLGLPVTIMSEKRLKKIVPQSIHPFLGKIYYWCRGIIYLTFFRGSACTCPFCHHSFRKFLPAGYQQAILHEKEIIGGGFRKNAECPLCASLDRERLVYLFVESRGLIKPGMRILHIAPEKNLQKIFSRTSRDYVSADLDSPLAKIKMDIQNIAFPSNHFDAIICNHVLEHISDDRKAMQELYRVLKKDGWAILQVPFSPVMEHSFEDPSITGSRERARKFGQSDHVRIYGLDYTDRLRSAGFSVTEEKTGADTINAYALNPDEVVFFCRK